MTFLWTNYRYVPLFEIKNIKTLLLNINSRIIQFTNPTAAEGRSVRRCIIFLMWGVRCSTSKRYSQCSGGVTADQWSEVPLFVYEMVGTTVIDERITTLYHLSYLSEYIFWFRIQIIFLLMLLGFVLSCVTSRRNNNQHSLIKTEVFLMGKTTYICTKCTQVYTFVKYVNLKNTCNTMIPSHSRKPKCNPVHRLCYGDVYLTGRQVGSGEKRLFIYYCEKFHTDFEAEGFLNRWACTFQIYVTSRVVQN